MKDYKKIIAVDFDGTIVTNEYPKIGKLIKNVVYYIREEKQKGSIIILWTCRFGEDLEKAKKFCEENNIPIDYYNENSPTIPFETSRKIFANEYIDDLAKLPGRV